MIRNGIPAAEVLADFDAHPSPLSASERLRLCKARIEARLPVLLDTGPSVPPQLQGAMRHALLSGGKRIRPLLLMLMAGPEASPDAVLDAGCAVEMVHTASLILDDLPCMDDAQMRRQEVTTHIKFGQATAILAAISLLTRSLNVISSRQDVPAPVRTRLVSILTDAVGQDGLAAGQELDVAGTGKSRTRDEVEEVNWLKTGKLFVATAEMAGIMGNRSEAQGRALRDFALHLGAAFQTLDDFLDATATAREIGKDTGKDGNKHNLVSLLGPASARRSWQDQLRQAEEALEQSGAEVEPIELLLRDCFDAAAASGAATVAAECVG